jgi:hypothetical protein
VKLRSLVLAFLIGVLSGCGLMPPTTIDMPLDAQQHCGLPEGTTLVFARDGVTLQELGLAADNPNPAANPRGTVYVTAEELPLVGTDGARARCLVFQDPTGTTTGSVGAVPDDWVPPQ